MHGHQISPGKSIPWMDTALWFPAGAMDTPEWTRCRHHLLPHRFQLQSQFLFPPKPDPQHPRNQSSQAYVPLSSSLLLPQPLIRVDLRLNFKLELQLLGKPRRNPLVDRRQYRQLQLHLRCLVGYPPRFPLTLPRRHRPPLLQTRNGRRRGRLLPHRASQHHWGQVRSQRAANQVQNQL